MQQKNKAQKVSEYEDRLKKLEELEKLDINPYPSKIKRSHLIKEVLNGFKKLEKSAKPITLTGRVRAIRSHGNLTFTQLQDETGVIQLALSKKEIGDTNYKNFVKFIDVGDFMEIKGACFVTHKGEESIMAKKWKILSKAVRPLPDKFHGITDDDKRQRFRELEMISDQKVLDKYKRRFEATKVIREFMWSNDFTEVETPILQNVYGGTYARPFTTHYNQLDQDFYLRIAPEIFLKRAVTGGFEKVFEIGKCFRNEGMGPAHLQEFTMFEFYWPYVDYEKLMNFTEKMIETVVNKVYKNYKVRYGKNEINFKPPFPRFTFAQLIKKHLKVDLEKINTVENLKKFIKEKKFEDIDFNGKKSWASMMDELYKKTIRKKIIQPIFVTDYPKDFMALAKAKDEDPKTVATFQLVVNTWELIKAYNELNDPVDQRERFESQDRLKNEGEEEAMPYDHDFVESMEYGMPPMAGWGMGLDRFFALLEGEENLRDMVIFPTMKKVEKPKICGQDEGDLGIDYKTAQKLIKKYTENENTYKHSIETEAIMRALAKKLGADEEKWGIVGLLHDIDWDKTKKKTKNHTVLAGEILGRAGGSEFLINTIQSHAYGNNECGDYGDKKRHGKLEYCLASAETLTGLIVASALMQPDKKLASVKLSSLKKKFKNKKFAANCQRDLILECEKAEIELEEFLEIGLKALQGISDKLGL